MDHRLRSRGKKLFSGFTKAEIEKMEKLLSDSGENVLDKEFCQNIATRFSRSSARAGKPVIKWTEVQNWFESQKQESANGTKLAPEIPAASPPVKELEKPEMCKELKAEEKKVDLTKFEFEARSSKDGAWYDVDFFLTHRFLSTGEPEARVRYAGFGAEEDEWVNIKRAVRERSIPLESSECNKVNVGDLVLCFQERKNGACYFDAHVLEIQRRLHDIRGCRCVFLVRYDHDDTEESVLLKRLCRRPSSLQESVQV